MEVFLNLERVSSQHNIKSLRRLFDSVESQVRGLRALGVSSESYGELLMSILLNNLPPEIRPIISRELLGVAWNLDNMMEVTETELSARQRAIASSPKSMGPGPSLPTAAAFMTPTHPSCVYRGQAHPSNHCSVASSAETRKQSLRRSGRCFVCLQRNHVSRNCPSSLRCKHCHGKHHDSICVCLHSQGTSGGSSSSASAHGDAATPVLYVNTQTPVLLQTVKIRVYDANGSHSTLGVRALLDGGSQRTYVTSRIQKMLSLPTSHTETVSIKTFGSKRGSRQSRSVHRLGIITRDGRPLVISALVVLHICDAIRFQPITTAKKRYPHLHQLDLADSAEVSDNLSVDLFLGSDYYWALVTGQVRRGADGPIAIETRLGWVLSGPVDGITCEQSITNFVSTYSFMVDTLSVPTNPDAELRRFWEL